MEPSAPPEGVLGPHAAALRAALLQPFLRLNFATLWVQDQERSRRFFMEKLDFQAIVDIQTPDGGRWIVVAPPAAGWLSETAGTGFTGMALVVPSEGSTEHRRIGQTRDLAFLPKKCAACSKNGRDAESVSRSHQWSLPGGTDKRGTPLLKIRMETVSL